KLIRDLLDADVFSFRVAPSPQRLQRRAVGRAIADLESHDFGVENIGHDLPPHFRVSAAARGADLGWFHAKLAQAAQTVIHAESYSFHRRAGKMPRGEGPRSHPQKNTGPGGDVWGAFTFKIRQQEKAF